MRLRRLATTALIIFSVVTPATGFGQAVPTCVNVREGRPAFFVIDSNHSLNRGFTEPKGVSADGYYPRGTIVKVNPDDLARIPLTSTTVPYAFYPRVKVMSVPDADPALGLDANRQATFSNVDGGRGQRAAVGMDGYINASDLLGFGGANVNSPSNMIFQVRQDSARLIAPEYRDRPIRLQTDGGYFVTRKCCSVAADAGENNAIEYDRKATCSYTPVFELLHAVDRGGQLTYTVDKRVAINDCDNFLAALSPVDPMNQRAAFMLSAALREPDDAFLARLQKEAWKQASAKRTVANQCGGGSRAGNASKCMCKQAVNDTLVNIGLISTRIPGNDAIDAADALPGMGFVNIIDKVHTAREAPPGCVMVYRNTRGGSGHIEIKVDNKTFCSDFCREASIDTYIPTRQLTGVFCKPR